VTPEQISRVRVQLDEACDRICNIQAPATGLEAKFSLKLASAMGLSGIDTGRLSTYSAEVATDPVLVALRDKVELDFRTGIPNTFAEMELLLTDGRTIAARHDSGLPSDDVTAQGKRLEEKFHALVEPVQGANRSSALVAEIRRFEALADIRALMGLAGG
jgi:2-methylcitrate dehydratase PrpD